MTSKSRMWRSGTFATMLTCAVSGMFGCSTGERPTVDREYAFWPTAPTEPRIQFVRSYETSTDVVGSRDSAFSRIVFGDEEESAVAVQKPYGITTSGASIYVCDIRSSSLTVLDLANKEMRLVGVGGFNRLGNPVDVEIADDGMIYVADTERGAVIVFNQKERFVRAIGFEDFVPISVAVHGDLLYTGSRASQVVDVFDRHSGEHIRSIGEIGDEDGQFRLPLGMETDAEGNLYVMDMMRGRLQKFSPEGELLAAVGAIGDVAGSFARPKQITIDSEGIIYIVDAAFQNVQMFNSDLELLMHFGSAGNFQGAMNLPAGICVAEDPRLIEYLSDLIHPGFKPTRFVLVTNQFGPDKVSVYALGQRRDEWTVAELHSSAADVSEGAGVNPDSEALLIDEGEVAPQAHGDETAPTSDSEPQAAPEGGGPG